jgi:hypothetical protein
MGTETDPRLSDKQYDEGYYWAHDGSWLLGTPPCQYNQILLRIARLQGLDTLALARMLGICNIAMADAGIVAWAAKYEHKYPRPVLAIRRTVDQGWKPLGSPRTNREFPPPSAFEGNVTVQSLLGSSGTAPDTPTAQSLLGASGAGPGCSPGQPATPHAKAAFTPNFPAYPSGHATFGRAFVEALREAKITSDIVSVGAVLVSEELNGLAIDNFKNELATLSTAKVQHTSRYRHRKP